MNDRNRWDRELHEEKKWFFVVVKWCFEAGLHGQHVEKYGFFLFFIVVVCSACEGIEMVLNVLLQDERYGILKNYCEWY